MPGTGLRDAPNLWAYAAAQFAPVAPDRLAWTVPCDVDDCDGEPHRGRPLKHARPKQIAPVGDWFVWLIMAGRGWGKSKTGGENLVDQMLALPAVDGRPSEWAIVAETFSDCRKVCVEGPAGLQWALQARDLSYEYNKSAWQVQLKSGQKVHLLGADDADVGRGHNLCGAWLDEFAKWPRPADTWQEGLLPALRIGPHPRAIVTTTPKSLQVLREWRDRVDGSVHVTRGAMGENINNLSETAYAELVHRYEGTRLGRQELDGELLDDVEGALWTLDMIAGCRAPLPETFTRIVVGVDPSGGDGPTNDEQGIVVVGRGSNGHLYVLGDYSCKLTPEGWASQAIRAYRTWDADRIVAERNYGGAMVESTIRSVDIEVPVKLVDAARGKTQRAEPVAALYEQGRVHHVGVFDQLETQMVNWDATATGQRRTSPDRMDALVWACTELIDRYTGTLAAPRVGRDGGNWGEF